MCQISYLALLLTKLVRLFQAPLGHKKTALLFFSAVFFLNGCGFHIRSDFQVPENLHEIALHAPAHNEIAKHLRDALKVRAIEVVPYTEQLALIEIGDDKLDRRILSLSPAGQVAEYELIYTLAVTFTDSQGQVSQQMIELTRDYQDDPHYALAKTREFELVVSEMRRDAVQRILILMNQYLRN